MLAIITNHTTCLFHSNKGKLTVNSELYVCTYILHTLALSSKADKSEVITKTCPCVLR